MCFGGMTQYIKYFYNSRIKDRSFIKVPVFHPTHGPLFWSKEAGALLGEAELATGKGIVI